MTGLDLVLYGATGFVGALTATYLAEHAPPGVAVGLAGRSRDRLEAVRDGLPGHGRDWPLLVADTADPSGLERLAGSTRLLISTVGPYARYGLPVVEACAEAGTDYMDLSGEVLFHRASIDRYDHVARATGARIVHACGYDAIPSDLGVLMLHDRAVADGAGELSDVRLVASALGGFSGGTVDAMRAEADAVNRDPSLREILEDPYALSPDRGAEWEGPQYPDQARPGRCGRTGEWTTTSMMADLNTRVVRRSNALVNQRYGRAMRYGEVMSVGSGPLAAVAAFTVAVGTRGLNAALGSPALRVVLDRVLPAPGTGPGPELRSRGWFRMELEATTTGGVRYAARVGGQGDPGYAATSVMLGESALCLALDDLPGRAGCLTPATAMGTRLVDRLRAAGHTYEVEQIAPAGREGPAGAPSRPAA